MKRTLASLLALTSFALLPAATFAADASGKPNATEAPLVASLAADLAKRFPTTAAAVAAGYLRYTDEDDTGAISYANRVWTSADLKHPSQLWYDAKGRLIGADFSVPATSKSDPPKAQFGFSADRWQHFYLHDHYGLVGPNGTTTYGAFGAKKIAAVGGDPTDPKPADVVKVGAAKSASDVTFVFAFPQIWDAAVWVIPNPDGAFAEKNPNVKPSAHAAMPGM